MEAVLNYDLLSPIGGLIGTFLQNEEVTKLQNQQERTQKVFDLVLKDSHISKAFSWNARGYDFAFLYIPTLVRWAYYQVFKRYALIPLIQTVADLTKAQLIPKLFQSIKNEKLFLAPGSVPRKIELLKKETNGLFTNDELRLFTYGGVLNLACSGVAHHSESLSADFNFGKKDSSSPYRFRQAMRLLKTMTELQRGLSPDLCCDTIIF